MATRLGDMAVGSAVKIKVNGTVKDFIIAHQGKPSSVYDDSCNGTWLLMKDIYTTSTFGNNNSYKDSSIHTYLNGTFYNLIDSNIRAAIKQVKIPYQNGTGSGGSLATGSNGLSTKVFLLSGYEVGWTTSDNGYFPKDGVRLAYFGNSSGSNSKRVAYNGSSAAIWWLRSPCIGNDSHVWYVSTDGSYDYVWYGNSYGVRPALILPSTLLVSDDGTVKTNTAPTINASSTNLGNQNAPFDFNYTVTDADGDLMTIAEKVNGVEMAVRKNVASGTKLTVQCLSEKALFQQILNGENTLTLEANDGKTTAEWTTAFTKNVTRAVLSLAHPLTADDTITVAALTLEGSFPADMSLTVEMTNNGLDNVPVWENCTDIQSGKAKAFVHHNFTNKTAAKGAAFNYKVTITRGGSGVGGNITMIGGVIG